MKSTRSILRTLWHHYARMALFTIPWICVFAYVWHVRGDDSAMIALTNPDQTSGDDSAMIALTNPDLTGKVAPPLTLKSADGKQVALASFRGKPVLIELWATWCASCVESLPRLAHLYQQTQKTSLVMIAIDIDRKAKDATDFLAKKSCTWPNFHDEGEVRKAFGASAIPRSILIDAKGEIVYDAVGAEEDDLLTAVSKLGPEYAFQASKKQQDQISLFAVLTMAVLAITILAIAIGSAYLMRETPATAALRLYGAGFGQSDPPC